ncbi:NADPH-dependent FMN reductase [Brevibacterium spongiae]|uniref:NAD(P)H-dependent oxidoreductase n=1 Tax=Brevibacterium spongiae TaxID=2909672 RepID=A0ABY5SP72_9MICO|nr:NAD(P)H-dependent oxidoreductase [Brevibacterium spongiae]UVI36328.1 NAD(P)H-dependent oxidoreductase [Brevibacterium spongiae]
MTTRIAVVVGNPSPGSRTRQVAEDLAARVADITGSEIDETIELAEVTGEIFEWKSDRLDTLTERLAAADYAIIASPTYKAAYTGLLKAFLDRYDAGGLHGLTAIPVFTIGSPAHTLAVETTLRPLLVELGASVPTKGLAFPTAKFDDRAVVLDDWVGSQGAYLSRGR